jgi:hypothetical protein
MPADVQDADRAAAIQRERSVSIIVGSFACQSWLVTPAALAVSEEALSSISDQAWLFVLTGVGIVDLLGNNVNDWRRETLTIPSNRITEAPIDFALTKYPIPVPDKPGEFFTGIELEQWSPFSAISSILDTDTGGVNAGFAVDAWRPTPFIATSDVNGKPANQIFRGIDVDVAVRNNHAILHRISYHITLLGKIVFLAGPL